MPKLAIFGHSKNDCAAIMELFSKTVENLDEELLDESFTNLESLMKCLDKKLQGKEKDNWAVFPVNIRQMIKLKTPEQLMRKYGINSALIIWRQQNNKIKKATKDSGTNDESTLIKTSTKRIKYSIAAYHEYLWNQFFLCWPIEIWPIFVQYEELFKNDECTIARIMRIAEFVGMVTVAQCHYGTHCKDDIAKSYNTLYNNRSTTLCTPPAQFRHALLLRAKLPPRLAHLMPEPEPHLCMPSNSVPIIRLCEPFIPLRAIQNVNEALVSKQVSSAGIWPKQLATKLRSIYKFPVAVPCSNGFTSLVLALRSANIGHGADVLVPSLTFVAVSNAVHNVGANPVFVDSSNEFSADYNPTWSLLERAATLHTRAVILTHTYGCPSRDIELIAAGCKKRGWTLIEDISECVGITTLTSDGDEQLLGTFGDYTCASLNANKIIHAGDGGFLLARDPSVGPRLQSLANHGYTKTLQFVHFEAAINGKINGLGAALACGVLDELDQIIAHRHLVSAWYRVGLAQLVAKRLLTQMPRCGPRDTPWLFCVQCRSGTERTMLRTHLADNGIETRNMFFPLHLQPMYQGAYVDLNLPTAQLLGATAFALPTHPGIDKHQTDRIVMEICKFFNDTMTTSGAELNVQEQPPPVLMKRHNDNDKDASADAMKVSEPC